MQEHELTAWLGGTPVTDEQRAALHRASDMIDARYADPDDRADAGQAAFTTAAQFILGDTTLDDAMAAWSRARVAERDAMAALTGAIVAASANVSEASLAARTGMSRKTIRKALGK